MDILVNPLHLQYPGRPFAGALAFQAIGELPQRFFRFFQVFRYLLPEVGILFRFRSAGKDRFDIPGRGFRDLLFRHLYPLAFIFLKIMAVDNNSEMIDQGLYWICQDLLTFGLVTTA
jgi:hypothetical protein